MSEEFQPLKPITLSDIEAEIRRLRKEWEGDVNLNAVLDAAEAGLKHWTEPDS